MTDFREKLQQSLGTGSTIERESHRGGQMSRVFLADETRLGRQVVVKVLSPELGAGVPADRFEREIKVAARLQHPHIVPLLTAGDVDGVPYYIMPFVSGASVRERLQAGPIAFAEAQSILRDVAKALAYAHRQGIVHRDIKPENVLLCEGTAVVTDFGVARAISAANTETGGVTLTQLGTQVGTPAYMAPEQAAGDPGVDFRADLYAFGVMAYELLAGRHPFAEKHSAQALITAHLIEAPTPLTTHATQITPVMSGVVMQCLGKDPQERPESASAVLAVFETMGGGVTVLPVAIASAPDAGRSAATIAVLPFTNMSGQQDNEYFSDGITDDIISALTGIPGLRVAARASAFSFKRRQEDLVAVGRTLGVQSLVQGTVRRSRNRVRVTAQLTNIGDGFQLWSERFDRDLDDIFAIQDEIARSIVQRVQIALGLAHQSAMVTRPTDDLQAYELYLRGREAVQQRTPPSMRRGLDFLLQAVARDPQYARAHLGVADAYIGLGVYQAIRPSEARANVERAIARAVALNPDLAAVHLLRAQLKLYLTPDWPSAGEDLADALRRDPNDSLANVYKAYLHALLGDRLARTEWAQRGVELDPLSPFVRGLAGMSYYCTGEYDSALACCEDGLAMDPNSVLCVWLSGLSYQRLGRLDEASDWFHRAVDLSRRSTLMLAFLHGALTLLGRSADGHAILDEMRTRATTEYVGACHWLMIALHSGDEHEIAAALRENIEAGTGPTSLAISVDVELADLLPHPRLGPLVRQLSLFAKRPSPGVPRTA